MLGAYLEVKRRDGQWAAPDMAQALSLLGMALGILKSASYTQTPYNMGVL